MISGMNLVETISLELGAQEPWPNDVKLYQPYAVEQILLPDNASCLAVQAFLHMCGLPFQIEHRANAEFMSPSGKVPFIKCGAFVISELEPIVQFVGNKGISLSCELDREQKADMRAYMSIIHTVLMNAELYICWCDKQTYDEVTSVRNGSVYPWPLNYFHTWTKKSSVKKWLKVHGWYQKTIEDVYSEVEICCKALSERLEGKEYFFGSKITEIDALLFGHIFAILSTPLKTNHFSKEVIKHPNLILHCKRICNEYMPHASLILPEKFDSSPSCAASSQTSKPDVGERGESPASSACSFSVAETASEPSQMWRRELLICNNEIKRTESKVNCSVTPLYEAECDEPDVQRSSAETRPTELDALVFGHLFTIVTTKLPNNEFANIIRNFPNLVKLIKQIEDKYFSSF